MKAKENIHLVLGADTPLLRGVLATASAVVMGLLCLGAWVVALAADDAQAELVMGLQWIVIAAAAALNLVYLLLTGYRGYSYTAKMSYLTCAVLDMALLLLSGSHPLGDHEGRIWSLMQVVVNLLLGALLPVVPVCLACLVFWLAANLLCKDQPE